MRDRRNRRMWWDCFWVSGSSKVFVCIKSTVNIVSCELKSSVIGTHGSVNSARDLLLGWALKPSRIRPLLWWGNVGGTRITVWLSESDSVWEDDLDEEKGDIVHKFRTFFNGKYPALKWGHMHCHVSQLEHPKSGSNVWRNVNNLILIIERVG